MSKVHVMHYVEVPFSAAMEYAERAVSRRDGLFLTPAPALGERVRFKSASTQDASDDTRLHDALLIAWTPQNQRLFPKFCGVLTVRPKRRGVWLRLSGEYDPPYGVAGRVFDMFAGRMIARQTIRHLLVDIGHDIEMEYRKEQLQHKSA